MNTALLLPQVHAVAASMKLRVAVPSERSACRADGAAHAAVTVASLRAVRKRYLVRLTDPARCVTTDFAEERPFIVSMDCPIEDASVAMFRWGVHTLIVLRDDEVVSGIITAENIEGGHIRRFLASHSNSSAENIRVRDLLTPCEELPAVDWETIRCARVGDLLHLVEAAGCTYLLVVETHDSGSLFLRGLVSRARLERQLEPSI